jgi:MarR family transcriptional regulator, organic hydroperoxide resistance regulator
MSVRSGKTAIRETEASLRHWLEAVPNDRLAHLVRDAARGLSRGLQLRLGTHSVSFGHWVFLRILWESDGLTQRELSVRAGVMEPTTFAAVKTLERLGYVTRRKKAGNRKNVYVDLTAAGTALKAKLVPLAEAVNEVAIAGIERGDIATTRRTLLTMIANLARDEAIQADGERRVRSTQHLSRMIGAARPARAAARAGVTRKLGKRSR